MAFGAPQPFGYPLYPAYAGRPPRRMSCWLAALLAVMFLVAGAGITAYFLIRQPLAIGGKVPAVNGQPTDSLELSPAERALQALRESARTPSSVGSIEGIQPGHTKQDVREKLGDPSRVESGYLITKKNEELAREIWHYPFGWVMFRYETVTETGRGYPPVLRKSSTLHPGGR